MDVPYNAPQEAEPHDHVAATVELKPRVLHKRHPKDAPEASSGRKRSVYFAVQAPPTEVIRSPRVDLRNYQNSFVELVF